MAYWIHGITSFLTLQTESVDELSQRQLCSLLFALAVKLQPFLVPTARFNFL